MCRLRITTSLVWLLACWQVLLLTICVPTAAARVVPDEPVAHECCERSTPDAPTPAVACPHCSDGNGQFVAAMTVPPLLAPVACVERIAFADLEASPILTLADERPLYRPPDPSLFTLRCELNR